MLSGPSLKIMPKISGSEILMDTTNRASERVAIKCGYKKEGVLRGKLLNKGNYFDAFLYAKVDGEQN